MAKRNKSSGRTARCKECLRAGHKARYEASRAANPGACFVSGAKVPCPTCGKPKSQQASVCRDCVKYPDRTGSNSPRWVGGYYAKYGITPDDYQFFFQMQGGLCAICNKPETNLRSDRKGLRSLAVDHDHVSGKVRGLLCGNCNRALGLLKDDAARFDSAAAYIRKHQKVTDALVGRPVKEI